MTGIRVEGVTALYEHFSDTPGVAIRQVDEGIGMEASPLNGSRRFPPAAATSRLLGLQPDGVLCALCGRGNEEAFGVLHSRYRQQVFAFVFHLLGRSGSVDDAEDLTQEIFQKAYANMNSRHESGSFKAWLFRIARNHTFDHIRARKPHALSLDDPDHAIEPSNVVSLHTEVEQRAELTWLIGAMGALPDRQRAALVMRELGGMSYDEIAESLDTNREGAKQLIKRGRATVTSAAEQSGQRSRRLGKELAAAAPITAIAWAGAGKASAATAGGTLAAGAAATGAATGGTVAGGAAAASGAGLAIAGGKVAATVLAVAAIGTGGVVVGERVASEQRADTAGAPAAALSRSGPAVPENSLTAGRSQSERAAANKQAAIQRRARARKRALERKKAARARARAAAGRAGRARSKAASGRGAVRRQQAGSNSSGGRSNGSAGGGSGNSGRTSPPSSNGGGGGSNAGGGGSGNGQAGGGSAKGGGKKAQ
jgi:RNA polymerase sigma factor (sigma-70 family)